jgi:hypothetical protein
MYFHLYDDIEKYKIFRNNRYRFIDPALKEERDRCKRVLFYFNNIDNSDSDFIEND